MAYYHIDDDVLALLRDLDAIDLAQRKAPAEYQDPRNQMLVPADEGRKLFALERALRKCLTGNTARNAGCLRVNPED